MTPNGTRLDNWKAIAAYLNKDVRTAIRWEKERHLPVHRLPGQKRSAVYAWTSEIDSWLNTAATNGVGGASVPAVAKPTRRFRKMRTVAAVAVVSLCVAAVLSEPWRQPAHPRIGMQVQITSDGREKRDLIARGDALYFDSFGGGIETVTRIDRNGGKQSFRPFPNQAFTLFDVSPDGSEMLFAVGSQTRTPGPLWIVPTNGDPPRRMAGLSASTAAWSQDGRKLAYVSGRTLFLANADGAQAHKIATLPLKEVLGLRWSPDGSRFRLLLFEDGRRYGAWWDVSVDGSKCRRLLPGWSRTEEEFETLGRWTPDGRFFVFRAFHNGTYGLWVIRQKSGWLDWRDRGPFQLTAGLDGVSEPALSKDGRKLYAVFNPAERGDLMRYDPGSGRFVMYPDQAGLSAAHTSYSPDGKQVAYVTYPQMSLWKMNVDGTGQKMLADRAALPQWSPDGRRIAFMGVTGDYRVPTKFR